VGIYNMISLRVRKRISTHPEIVSDRFMKCRSASQMRPYFQLSSPISPQFAPTFPCTLRVLVIDAEELLDFVVDREREGVVLLRDPVICLNYYPQT
ncbi:hypothetical protein PMAYCL1PPCAC_27225, partial [Pristionchus mayeri]